MKIGFVQSENCICAEGNSIWAEWKLYLRRVRIGCLQSGIVFVQIENCMGAEYKFWICAEWKLDLCRIKILFVQNENYISAEWTFYVCSVNWICEEWKWPSKRVSAKWLSIFYCLLSNIQCPMMSKKLSIFYCLLSNVQCPLMSKQCASSFLYCTLSTV